MDIVFSPKHALQDAQHELIDGRLQPPVEMPRRADVILEALRTADVGPIHEPDAFPEEALTRVHTSDYVAFLNSAWGAWQEAHGPWDALPLNWPQRGFRQKKPESIDGLLSYYSFDAGTPITAGTWEAARASADVALSGASRVAGGAAAAFSLCRPPGHHAAADVYGGYCFLNNAAIAAQFLRDNGCRRVAVLDVDYHHGNGTQAIFYDRADVFFASLHADPAQEFPFFLGFADETGEGAGEGFNANYPMRWGTGWDDGYSAALDDACGRLAAFGAEALVVSLGVDTLDGDPISRFRLRGDDYRRMGARIAALGLPTLFVMEGGYAIDGLGGAVTGVVGGFLDAAVAA